MIDQLRKLRRYHEWYGLEWTLLRVLEWGPGRLSRWLDRRMVGVEKRQGLRGPGAITGLVTGGDPDAIRKTREYWDGYEWHDGNVWTSGVERLRGVPNEEWASQMMRKLVLDHTVEGSTVLEIGPGSGRWSAYLQPACDRLILIDVSGKAIDLCRRRFATATNIEYHVSADGSLTTIDDDSADLIFAYGVFVDFDEAWSERLLGEFPRILRPGGRAVIHHRDYLPYADAATFETLASKHGLELVEQNYRLTARPGEVFTVMSLPRVVGASPILHRPG